MEANMNRFDTDLHQNYTVSANMYSLSIVSRFDTALLYNCSRLMTAWNHWNNCDMQDEKLEDMAWWAMEIAALRIKRYLRD
jgi:hypothetical protein